MWKRFNAPFRRGLCAGVIVAALGGCDAENLRQDKGSEADIEGQAEAAQYARTIVPEPGVARNSWRPSDAATSRVTGKLTASLERGRSGTLALAFVNGITVRLERLSKGNAGVLAAAPTLGSFATMLGVEDDTLVFVYRVLSEDVERVAPFGGLCGRVKTTHVAIAEAPTQDGQLSFKIAAFSGASEPGAAESTDAQLCAMFNYVLA